MTARQFCVKKTGIRGSVCAMAVLPDGSQGVLTLDNNILKVWDTRRGRAKYTLQWHSGGITTNGRRVVITSYDALTVWDFANGELRTLEGFLDWGSSAMTPDGRLVVAVTREGTQLRVWDLEAGAVLRTLPGENVMEYMYMHRDPLDSLMWPGHVGGVNALAVAPDGRQAFLGLDDGNIQARDLVTGKTLRGLGGHNDWVSDLEVTPDGQSLVSASKDKTLKVWDVARGTLLRTLRGHSQEVTAVKVTPDSQMAVSISKDKTLAVWDLRTGTCTATFLADEEIYSCCVISMGDAPDRMVIAVGDRSGKVYFLEPV